MQSAVITVVLVVILSLAGALAGYVPDRCMDCMCRVLSRGCRMPSPPCELQGPGFLVCGPYQISKAYWKDARTMGKDLMEGGSELFVLGHDPTCEDFARIHKGGPLGYSNDATLQYWESVARCLQGDPQFYQPNTMNAEQRSLQLEL
uniref:lysozyme n=1 Tax=Branchiostoma floridae TaxID=7739 RepID=C3ZBZ6_BRAFL|eukprot:XP_002593926.1 hypothetical protein BRAFLDRAFT_98225 [Branchiostoma floridae]